MFVQILLGGIALIRGAFDFFTIWFRSFDPLSHRIKEKKTLHSFRAKRGFLSVAMAVLFVSMAFIEEYEALQPTVFVLVYIVVGLTIVAADLVLNFKYLGDWH